MRPLRTILIGMCAALFATTPVLSAQVDSAAQRTVAGPPIQRIATASAVSTERLGVVVMSVRELPDGRVLVNDGMRRRLLLMDTTMTTVRVVLDSLSDVANTYGIRPGALIPYRADSTLFVDAASYAVVVLDPHGNIARIRSVWRVQHIPYFSAQSPGGGAPGTDSKGRIVYRIPAVPAPPRVRPPPGVPYIPHEPDSAFVIAFDLETRTADTLGVIRTPRVETRARRTAEGGFTFDQIVTPIPTSDDWAITPDGRVAFVRWRDYRVEFVHPDGRRTSSQKLPYEWQRLTDADKQRIVDSVRVAQQKLVANQYVASVIRWVNQYGKGYPKGFTVPEGFVPPPGMPRDWILPEGVKFPANYQYACAPGVEPAQPASGPAIGGPPVGLSCVPAPVTINMGSPPPLPTMRQVSVLPASDLPDFKPPISQGSTRADMEGNLWIRTIPAKPTPGGPVYDIVNPEGALIARYQLPPGYTIVGFGRGKVVYFTMRDANGLHVARVRLK